MLFTLHVPFPTRWGLHPMVSGTSGGVGVWCPLPEGLVLLTRTTPSARRKALGTGAPCSSHPSMCQESGGARWLCRLTRSWRRVAEPASDPCPSMGVRDGVGAGMAPAQRGQGGRQGCCGFRGR